MGFFDDVLDVLQDITIGAGRAAARILTPDPIEAAIQVFFPDTGAQVFGSPMGLPAPAVIPPSFPTVISEAGATPPPFSQTRQGPSDDSKTYSLGCLRPQ